MSSECARSIIGPVFPRRLTLQCRNLQMNNANGALQVGANQDDDARHMGVFRVTNNCRWERYHSTGRSRDRPRPGRLKTTISVFRHRFRAAISTAS